MKAGGPAPLLVLTGFLGSGKTTVLSRLLQSPTGARTAVLINEVGQVALDHLLVARLDQDVSLLPAGCVCCAVGGELEAAMEAVLAHDPARIVLETTGLADPAPVLHGLGEALARSEDLRRRVAFGGVVVTVDASRGTEVLDAEPEGALQLDLADRVLLTKLDIAAPEPVQGLRDRLATDHPSVPLLPSTDPRALEPVRDLRANWATRWRLPQAAADGHGIDSRVIELPSPVDLDALSLWLRMVAMIDGPRLLRVKGIVQTREGWAVVQSAQRAVSPLRPLDGAPPGWSGSRLVVLSRGMPAAALEALVTSAIDAATAAPRSGLSRRSSTGDRGRSR